MDRLIKLCAFMKYELYNIPSDLEEALIEYCIKQEASIGKVEKK